MDRITYNAWKSATLDYITSKEWVLHNAIETIYDHGPHLGIFHEDSISLALIVYVSWVVEGYFRWLLFLVIIILSFAELPEYMTLWDMFRILL